MLAAVIIVAAAFASNGQNLIVSKTYYDTGLAFDGSQWTQNPQSGPMTFTVYEESLHMSDGSWAIRSGNATVYGFTGRKYIFVGADEVARPSNYCKGYDHKHYHETCSSCNGKGGYYR